MLSAAQIQDYQELGYVAVRQLFTQEEAELLHQTSISDTVISEKSYDLLDASGFKTRLALWYTPGDDVYGMMSRSRRMVSAVEQLLGGPVGHYHSKVMQKAPRTGGAWEWHQDYGYWYKKRVSVSRYAQRYDCLDALNHRKWLLTGVAGLAQNGPYRAPEHRRTGRC